MQSELMLARQMQENLLPVGKAIDDIEASSGVRIASHFQPSAELGGDMWSLHNLGEGLVGVAVVDFAGHGLTAAMNTFRLHTLITQLPPDPDEPAAYLAALNARLVDLLPTDQFATMFYGVIDTKRDLLVYSAAGAPSPILGAADIEALDASGLPLGISRTASYANTRVAFPPGSFLLLYSDALIETPDVSGQFANTGGLIDMVRRARAEAGNLPPLGRLIRQFQRDREPISDDLTVVWLSRDGPNGINPMATSRRTDEEESSPRRARRARRNNRSIAGFAGFNSCLRALRDLRGESLNLQM